MMKRADFENILAEVSYKTDGGYVAKLDVVALAPEDGFPSRHGPPPLALRVQAWVLDGSNRAWQKGRKWYLSPHMTKSEVVLTALKAVLTFEEHETRERFRYRGARIAGPHLDVDALASMAGQLENLDIRSDRSFE